MTTIPNSLAEISAPYDALFVDLWGCLHDGIHPFVEAVEALRTYKAGGGFVLLMTNSPKPKASVIRHLDRMGMPTDIWDEIASSGDATQAAMMAGMAGEKVYHLGPERDLSFFNDMPVDLMKSQNIERVPLEDAEGIVCTGLFDDKTETPEDYRLTIMEGVNRGLKFLCANPDITVDYGNERIFCSGAVAQAYEDAGGTSLYFGKPHPPIYQLGMSRLAEIAGHEIPEDRILCIGDGINTDILGAMSEGMDSLFLTGGLAAQEIPAYNGKPDRASLETYLADHQMSPTYVMEKLR